MCGLRPLITAAVVTPLLPDPPVTGGQKRTLRLLEAMERAGLHPHLLTADPGEPGAADRLRARGWEVDIMLERPPGLLERARQHASRLPSPLLHQLAGRFAEVASRAALVQFEHTQSAYYAAPPGVPSVLSLHNLDSSVARSPRRASAAAWRGCASRTAPPRCASSSGACSRSPTASCACPRPTPTPSSPPAGARCWRPTASTTSSSRRRCATRGERALFFGHFGYEANRRGVERFLEEGWPEVLRARPQARLAIAGGGMDDALRARLAAVEGVEVLGLVADLPGALAAARAVVVPIWEGGGTRLKVLEALAAGRAVVATSWGPQE